MSVPPEVLRADRAEYQVSRLLTLNRHSAELYAEGIREADETVARLTQECAALRAEILTLEERAAARR